MKTLTELKELIDYQQTDEHFIAFLTQLAQRGMLLINEGDICSPNVSNSLFSAILSLYGVPASEEEFKPHI